MKSARHLAYVRQHPCCICNRTPVEAHHLLKPWQGVRGMALKAGDQNAVPLCPAHHRALHMAGDEFHFFECETGDRHHGKVKAMELWFKSPAYEITG